MFCSQCGSENKDQARFCRECGSPLRASQAASPSPKPTSPRPSGTSLGSFSPGQIRWCSPSLFGLVLVGFLLPFADLSCAGEHVVTLTGTNLALGTRPAYPSDAAGGVPDDASSRCGLATLAVACAVIGLILGIRAGGASTRGQALCAALGTLLLFGLKLVLESQIREGGEGMIALTFRFGYWLTLLGLLAGALFNGWQVLSVRRG